VRFFKGGVGECFIEPVGSVNNATPNYRGVMAEFPQENVQRSQDSILTDARDAEDHHFGESSRGNQVEGGVEEIYNYTLVLQDEVLRWLTCKDQREVIGEGRTPSAC